jgi:hypothetical protein
MGADIDKSCRHLTLVVGASTVLIGAAAWMLAALHRVEATIWALAYLELGAVVSLRDPMLDSIDSITTRAASIIDLRSGWALRGLLEVAEGMLLLAVSTAFLFAVISRVLYKLNVASTGKADRALSADKAD